MLTSFLVDTGQKISNKIYLGWNTIIVQTFCLENPGSITNTTPSIVRDVSAMLVDTTHLRPMAPLGRLDGAGSKMRCCCCGGRVEYRGMQRNSPTSGPKFSTSFFNLLQASSISYVNGIQNRIVINMY